MAVEAKPEVEALGRKYGYDINVYLFNSQVAVVNADVGIMLFLHVCGFLALFPSIFESKLNQITAFEFSNKSCFMSCFSNVAAPET